MILDDPNLKIPFVKLLKIRTTPNVQRATTQFFILPNSFDPAPQPCILSRLDKEKDQL